MHHSDGAVVAPLRTTRARVATLLHISLSLSLLLSRFLPLTLSVIARVERAGGSERRRRSEGAKDERANERASECERKSGSSASVRKSRRCVSASASERARRERVRWWWWWRLVCRGRTTDGRSFGRSVGGSVGGRGRECVGRTKRRKGRGEKRRGGSAKFAVRRAGRKRGIYYGSGLLVVCRRLEARSSSCGPARAWWLRRRR